MKFSLLGSNTAGLKNKKDSLEAVIELLRKPSCITLQETKLPKKNVFKLNEYQVFQKNRNGSGGGLLTAVDPILNPMLISTENEEAEILTVQLTVNNQNIRIINGYGPQEDDKYQNKLNFWMGLDQEIVSAKSESCLIMIQMDANAKVGRKIISADPNNVTDGNGQQMLDLIDRHGLQLLNADQMCTGAITRCRVTTKNTEVAILDYVLVCQELYKYFEKMAIDEERNYTLTKFATTKGNKKKVLSDHNPMLVSFSIEYDKGKNQKVRREMFNLKNPECQSQFFEETNKGLKFQQCFKPNLSFEAKCNKFIKTLDDSLHKCFTKIRIKKGGGRKSDIQGLIVEKAKLSISLPSVGCVLGKQIVENEITKLEDEISEMSASKNAKIVKDFVKNLDTPSGNFSQLGMWKLKNLLCPNQTDPPMAKKDKHGTLLTAPNLVKKLYLETYKERLANRRMKTELDDLFCLKSELWNWRLDELEGRKTKMWTVEDLEKVLKGLKTNKTRDPHGLINEIFKPGVLGEDLKLGMLALFNTIKQEQKLPIFLQFANITTIFKKKGSPQDMNNDRGIFVVSVMRMILDSLIYVEKYPLVDSRMSNSNIGGRKNRNIRDHLFIVYGIINSVLNGNDAPVDIQIYDVEKCFDALWLEDCMMDIYETLPPEARDDKVSLIYKMNQDNYVAVNTAVGQTKRVNMKNIVMQGGKWGPLKCSNTMDKIGKKCVNRGEHLYTYKGMVKVMPLAMVDDLLAVAKCGKESTNVNTFINGEIEMKKLKFHVPDSEGKSKCNKIHIGKRKMGCQGLQVHGCPMKEVKNDAYLGDIISCDGKNTLNIESRVSKGLGIVSQIIDLLKCVSFGVHYFEIAATLREAMLVNGLLTNSEVWYGLSDSEVTKLEEVDRLFLRQIFQVASTCPIEALYLELGCVPLGLIIKSRRIKYLHHLVTRDESEMLNKFFQTQWKHPAVRNEWTEQVRLDLKEFGIKEDLEWIKSKSKLSFKLLMKKVTREVAKQTLERIKEKHSKMENLMYADLEMQSYLKDDNIRVDQARTIFRYRTRMARYWENFKGGRPPDPCPVCKEAQSVDSQAHSFHCEVTASNVSINGNFCNIFGVKVDEKTAKTVENIEKFRAQFMEK